MKKTKHRIEANKVIEFSDRCIPGTNIRILCATREDFGNWAARVSSEQVAENDRHFATMKAHNQICGFIISRLAALEEAERKQASQNLKEK
jgi:hypothetical protein